MSELVEQVADAIELVTIERQGQGFHLVTGRNDSEAFARAALSLLEPRIEQLERELAEAVAAERERCAGIAEKWRDENKAAAAKARKRTRALAGSPFQDPGMADMLDGAAIECNAIAAAIRNGERG